MRFERPSAARATKTAQRFRSDLSPKGSSPFSSSQSTTERSPSANAWSTSAHQPAVPVGSLERSGSTPRLSPARGAEPHRPTHGRRANPTHRIPPALWRSMDHQRTIPRRRSSQATTMSSSGIGSSAPSACQPCLFRIRAQGHRPQSHPNCFLFPSTHLIPSKYPLRTPTLGSRRTCRCAPVVVRYRDGGRVFYRPSTGEPSQPLGHTPPMIVGLLLIVVAGVLSAWATMRLAAANPAARLPFVGWPPHKPSGAWLLNFMTVQSLIWGVLLLFRSDNHLSQLWLIPVFLTVLAAGLVPCVIHNRRVGRSV